MTVLSDYEKLVLSAPCSYCGAAPQHGCIDEVTHATRPHHARHLAFERLTRDNPRTWDSVAEHYGVVIGSPGYIKAGHTVLGYTRPPGPSRIASSRCESGKRPYCTCDTCF